MTAQVYELTYNSFAFTSANGIQLDGKHELTIADGTLRFSQKFFLYPDTSSGVAATIDASLGSRIAAMYAAATVDDAALLFKIGATTLISWSPAANTGFRTRATISKAGDPGDSARGAGFRLTVTAEREPQQSARLGRREASVAISYTADRLRTLEFSGTYTARTSGAATALATYLAQIATWIATWTGAGKPLAPISGAVWQRIEEPRIVLDDENKLARFSVRYRETLFSATPSDTTKGIYTIGTFTRADPQSIGAKLDLGGGGAGEPNPLEDHRTVEAGSGNGVPATSPVAFRRYNVNTTTFIIDADQNVNDYFDATIRAWIVASVQAIFGADRCIFENLTVVVSDVQNRSVVANGQILVATTGAIIEWKESIETNNNRNLQADVVYSGIPDDFDISEGGRRLTATHTVRQVRLDSPPTAPPFIGRPWHFLRDVKTDNADVIDPITQRIMRYVMETRREYLYVSPNQSGGSGGVLTPSPLGGRRGGSRGTGGAVTTGGPRDADGVSAL